MNCQTMIKVVLIVLKFQATLPSDRNHSSTDKTASMIKLYKVAHLQNTIKLSPQHERTDLNTM